MQLAFHLCYARSLPEIDVESIRLRSIDLGSILTACGDGAVAVTMVPICHRHDCVSSKYGYSLSTVLRAPIYSNAL